MGYCEIASELTRPFLKEPLHLTGSFAKWSTKFPESRLLPAQALSPEGTVRLRLCVRLTSASFSFQVVTAEREWSWRFYPRDAQNIRFTNVSRAGLLKEREPGAVAV